MDLYLIEFDGFRLAKGVEFDPFGMGTKMNPQIAQMGADYFRVEFGDQFPDAGKLIAKGGNK